MPEIFTSTEKLVIIEQLFDAIHEEGIVYCHWKSNEHLDASMQGDTDLDVLFNIQQKAKLERILERLDFKKFESIKEKTYKDIVDYIGFDKNSGKVVHLHTHYRLTLGEAYLKGYQLDIESVILATRCYDERFEIYCIDPHYEQVLLFIREALKIRRRDRVKNLFGRARVNANALRESQWLESRTSYGGLYAAIRKILKDADAAFRIISTGMTFQGLLELSLIVREEFQSKRLYSPLTANAKRWHREVRVKAARVLAKFFHRPVTSRRVNPRGGVIIAVIGADGSGKSTVTEILRQTFEKKMDVFKVYFGRGDGKRSVLRGMLQGIKSIFRTESRQAKVLGSSQIQENAKRPKGLRLMYKCMEAVTVAWEKRDNLRLIAAAKQKGALIICDRYPQNQFMGYNDGPLLHELLESKNFLLRALAKYERDIYASSEEIAPDIVIKLIADAEVVEARKPNETRFDVLVAKINAVKSLRVSPSSKEVMIDAVQPLQNVLMAVKNVTWDAL